MGVRSQPRTSAHGTPSVLVLLVAAALAGCSRPAAEAPMSGYAEAELVYVAPPLAGTLHTLAVKRGDSVSRGQALAAFEADIEALNRDAAEARRERALALQRNLEKGRRPNELRAIAEQLAQAEAQLGASTHALQRNRQLVEQGFLAATRLDEFSAARERDAARVRELQAQQALAQQAARADEVAAARADVRAGSAEAELARYRQGQRQLVAPVAGQVFDVLYRPGEWVGAGAPLLALLPPGALKIRFFVPEPALAAAAIGREVALSCEGCPAGLRAHIRYVAPQAEYTPPVIYSVASRSKLVFMVEADPGPASPLKPGQPVDVRWAGDAR